MGDKFIRKFGREGRRQAMQAAWEASGTLLEGMDRGVVEVRPITRSDEQNAKLHAMLGDIAEQATWQGDKLDIDGWKNLFVSGHTIATRAPYKLVTGLEGELVNVRERTSKMGVRRCASLIEYVQAWGAENGIKFKARPVDYLGDTV